MVSIHGIHTWYRDVRCIEAWAFTCKVQTFAMLCPLDEASANGNTMIEECVWTVVNTWNTLKIIEIHEIKMRIRWGYQTQQFQMSMLISSTKDPACEHSLQSFRAKQLLKFWAIHCPTWMHLPLMPIQRIDFPSTVVELVQCFMMLHGNVESCWYQADERIWKDRDDREQDPATSTHPLEVRPTQLSSALFLSDLHLRSMSLAPLRDGWLYDIVRIAV